MINFLMYFVFSTIEFLGFMFLLFSLFTFDWKSYKKEMLLTSVSVTLISYLCITLKIEPLILPIEIVVLVITFKIGLQQKWLYSLWIVIAGLFTYLVIQTAILLITIQAGFITYAETSQTFGFKTYLLQCLTATIVISIASFIRLNRQGFGFVFRTNLNKRLYLTIALVSVVILSALFYFFSIYLNFLVFCLSLSSIALVFSVLLYFSYRKDHEEFSFS